MSIADEVKRLEDENASLHEDYTKLRDMLERQASNFREHLAKRNQQLIDAAAQLEAADIREAQHMATIVEQQAKINRFQAHMGAFQDHLGNALRECEHGASPLGNRRIEGNQGFFQLPAARAN